MTMLSAEAFEPWSFAVRKFFKAVFEPRPSEEVAKLVRETLGEKEVAMYVHIPFCTGTCTFCPYARRPVARNELEHVLSKYFRALATELRIYSEILGGEELRIVDLHVGGGTPSLVPGRYWRFFLEELTSRFDAEPRLAIEANPEDLRDEGRTHDLVDSGVNEVSLGIQTFNPRLLRVLGRRHSVEDSLKAIDNLRQAGCDYINIDLMYAIPGETLDDWVKDLDNASSLNVDEITCYPTLVTRGTPGYELMKRGALPPQPSMRTFRKMVYACEDLLPRRGFRGVEIYGYSRREGWKYFTVNYEMEGPLIGLGAGAMGFTGGFEYQNTCFPEHYVSRLIDGKLPIAGCRRVSVRERAVRYVVCRLFICRELSKKSFSRKFGRSFDELIGKSGFGFVLRVMKLLNYVEERGDVVSLTRKGLFEAHRACWAFVLNVPCRITEEFMKSPWPSRVEIP